MLRVVIGECWWGPEDGTLEERARVGVESVWARF